MESSLHKHYKNQALYWLKAKMTDLCASEVKLYYRRKKVIADAVGINFKRKESRIIEVKVSKEDFRRDAILDAPYSYYALSHYAYILTPKGLLLKEEIPKGYGLLEMDEFDNIAVKRKPVRNAKPIITLDTLVKRTGRAATNAFLFKELSRETKDDTKGAYAKGAVAHLISATCQHCKKRNKYIVKKEQDFVMCEIKSCSEMIPLNKARVHYITAYNQKFYKDLKKLME
ncbi:hypothetical protein [Evansella cellulosilytica]|uniref:Uncharacterized protein n=1 Tax=Evansella cellulosilytica (strain ATCC 21833 / DSM 2522 / FERM P-1141 / JCM 9156 / N-4) TaxID=649639 RepID=E6U0Z8_EVAC2|nr:hypothetical protein [Evansella cellulosilytica]ADU30310.1 hypothetical protein Bcell_2048 [Evansella cellulosilytica DSM 2522]